MRQLILTFFIVIVTTSCHKQKSLSENFLIEASNNQHRIKKDKNTIKSRFNTPSGYKRINTKPNTFANYLQNFKLKPYNAKVHLYNGDLKSNQNIHAGILAISIGKNDLQQCADATMRLRAEYLFAQKKYDAIHFNFTNGFRVDYTKWRKGYRLKVKGHKVSWYKTNKESRNYDSFTQYMKWIFMYAGTLSLSKELKSIKISEMKIGDVFIQGGSPGHAIIIVDMAKNDKDETIFMVAQSYMPAQDIHILKNLNNERISPWYKSKDLNLLNTPEWQFTKDDLKRFN